MNQPKSDDAADDSAIDATVVSDTRDANPPPAASSTVAIADRIGDYQIEQKLGEGGMGTVYSAIDPANAATVAIKMMNPSLAAVAGTVQRFRREVQLLREVNNPWLANLLDSGEHEGVPFMVMEFIDGTDLQQELRARDRIPENESLQIAADIARALVPAHERGIIHRDIKPSNVLLQTGPAEPADAEEDKAAAASHGGHLYRVRLADFGLARHVNQTESMQLTRTGAFVGTPRYMAPEQCRGRTDLTPETDVYALGVTLFELLTGQPPFDADDPVKLASMHCLDDVPALTRLEDSVSEATVTLVNRALSKNPDDRFADAAEFLDAVEQIQCGQLTMAEQHPVVPDASSDTLIDVTYEWNLSSTPSQLWPLVSHTERINEAIGLPAVTFTSRRENGVLRRFGRFRLAGIPIEWEEHPFEWVEGSRFGVLREFSRGPFTWLSSIVTLSEVPRGGTVLKHRIRIQPRGAIGRLLGWLEVNVKAKRALNRVYAHIDRVVYGNVPGHFVDPWRATTEIGRAGQRRLNHRAGLLREEPVDRRSAELLCRFLATAPAQEVGRIRPLQLAEMFDVDPDQFVRLCLYAAHHELLLLQWDLICPTCRVPSDSRRILRDIEEHATCESCDIQFQVDLGESLELSLKAHPDIRHADAGTYCIGGPGHSPHVAAQIGLQPGENLRLTLQLAAGDYIIRGPRLPWNIPLHVADAGGGSRADIEIQTTPGTRPMPLLAAGTQRLRIRNGTDQLIQIRIERTLRRKNLLTARAVASRPEFRTLFPLEAPSPGRLLSMSRLSLLAIEYGNYGEAIASLGDVDACSRFVHIARQLRDIVTMCRGAIFRENDGTLWASFNAHSDALQAAATAATVEPDKSFGTPTVVLHRGSVVAMNQDNRLQYAGQSIQTCVKALKAASPGTIVLCDPEARLSAADLPESIPADRVVIWSDIEPD